MGWLEKREACTPTHVAGLLFTASGNYVQACFVLPVAAVRDGKRNHTLPGGGIHQTSARRFETPENALKREVREEIGCSEGNWDRFEPIGLPVERFTYQRQRKLTQPFVGILHQPCSEPTLRDEIAAVHWCEPDAWREALASMNEGKRQFVLAMMQEAVAVKVLFPCMRRALRGFLRETNLQFLPG